MLGQQIVATVSPADDAAMRSGSSKEHKLSGIRGRGFALSNLAAGALF